MAWLCAVISPVGLVSDVIVGDALVLTLAVGDDFVVVITLWVARDNVPGVDQAGEVAEHAEQNIDDGVGGADAGFDPDWLEERKEALA